MKQVTAFKSKDGRLFESEQAAQEAEDFKRRMNAVWAIIGHINGSNLFGPYDVASAIVGHRERILKALE